MKVRIRHPSGSISLGIPADSTHNQVSQMIATKVPTLPCSRQVWKTGFPPRRMECNSDDIFAINEMIHVSLAKDNEKPSVVQPSSGDDKAGTDGGGLQIVVPKTAPQLTDLDGFVVKRVIPADNACLFNSIGYTLLNRSLKFPAELRELVSKAVRENPELYTEAFLGKSPDEYIQFITTASSWGGQIELLIFSRLFEAEIAACDIIRNRVDIYGQEENYLRRIYVMYDGIHYDCLAYTFDLSLPQDADVTQFSIHDDTVLTRARTLCAEQHRAKKFTDTSNFKLRCVVCQKGLSGTVAAEEHAQITGHSNFAEF